MRKGVAFLLVSLGLLSCNQGRQSYQGDVEIEVAMEANLQDEIQVVSAVGKKPGALNPVETLVELRNVGDTEARVLCEGTWQGEQGGFCGSLRSVRVLQPLQTHAIQAATRSEQAVLFKLAISRTKMTEDELLTSALDETVPRADGHGLSYTETPTAEQIPAWPLRGVANGVSFLVKTIIFAPISGQWKLQLIDSQVDPLKGLAIARLEKQDIQVININLPKEPTSGDVFEKKMSYGGGYFQIKRSPSSQETTSWNTELAWVIEITKWDSKPWIEGGGTFQQVGTASGRLYVCLKGSQERIKSSWVSGTFENAAIVFYGKPT